MEQLFGYEQVAKRIANIRLIADTPSGCYNLEWYKKCKVCSDAFEDLANEWSI